MKKFVLKSVVYLGLILLALELLVRAFHLHADDPPKMIDEFGVEKRVPGSKGHYVKGNRRQHFTHFSINGSGFNSYREFEPSEDKYEVALVGDSFIEGFHQDYDNSLGKKIEDRLPKVEVFEYGYTGATMAYQMHLVDAYRDRFDKIDKVILYMKFRNDFDSRKHRADYELVRMLKTLPFRIRENCKLWVYGSNYGMTLPIKNIAGAIWKGLNFIRGRDHGDVAVPEMGVSSVTERIDNFKKLIATYGWHTEKTILLLDSRVTDGRFLDFCDENGIRYLDFSEVFQNAKAPVTLVYDKHWNDYGRELIAEVIADYLQKEVKP
ncbi:hypothetical protein [Ulvibacterium marinum]|uniref:SGNH/GDSL hydrolase family protein n=1 Tax=Ulvibacterium marinum TaxID=2419782 RepID=A0A3B0C4Y9_9FLAO|nr:hypothetical protein [Ulvibacterium marinum]RKN79771.1 hypothetical protein D7Z94_15945 [Ulvibacterium marinum]